MTSTRQHPKGAFAGLFSRHFIAFTFFHIFSSFVFAQSTNIAIGNTVLQPSVKRLGINLGLLTTYDSGQTTKNLVMANPGFEGQVWNSTIRCAFGTATTCVDEDQFSGWPAGFWTGATYEIFYGAAAGRTGTINYYAGPAYGEGGTFIFGDSNTAPAAGDYMIVHMKVPGGSTGGWYPNTYGAGTVTDNLTDNPPGSLGTQTVALNAPTINDFAGLSYYFDSTPGHTFIKLNGTFQLQFKAKATGGTNQMYVQANRYGGNTYVNELLTLTNSWNTYTFTFTASEDGTPLGSFALEFSTAGGSGLELDDVSLTQTNTDPTNTSVFLDPVVNTLRAYNPGILRYWGGQLGDTLDNLLTPAFGRQRSGYSAFYPSELDYGLHDFLVLCQTVGAEPWFVVPPTFTTTDASNLIQYLAGNSSTPYGAKRAALGQNTPWTQVFPKIHLEFGNEAWNGTFEGGNIEYVEPYAGRAQTIFGVMRANPSYVPAAFDLVLGGQAASPGRNSGIQNLCNNNDSFDVAAYTMGTVDSYSDNESLFGSSFAEPEAFVSSATSTSAENLSPGIIYQDYQAILTSNHPVPLSFYEVNMGTTGGTITQQALNTYASSLGAGLTVADTMLQSLQQFGVVNQNLFALPQYQFTRPDGSAVYLWGSVVDMGVTDRRRPQYLALQLANQALSNGASMLQTTQTGANPTWNEALTNTVQFTGAHEVQSYVFQNGSDFSTIVFNLSRTSALPVTFSGANAPSGTVQMQQLTSANLTDTNETSEVVNTTSSVLSSFSSATGLSLPPYSMTVLTWSTGAHAPIISSVLPTQITSSSATINWTTDIPATSQVNYGTTTAYGSSSPSNSALTTSHSVTLTGLTSGTSYDFDVTSANSAGTPTTSSNSSFSTWLPAPVISNINVTNVTNTAATISWTTDQASTGEILYGATTLGSAILNSTLSTSHSITLSGLVQSSTYNFQITAANASGSAATSSALTFSTSLAPTISAVAVSNVTSTSALVTWTTNEPSSSQVQYGTTTSYGSVTSVNSTLVTTHSVQLTGLMPNVAYNFDVISTNGYLQTSTSPNATFSTTFQTPTNSYVTAASITNTSAVISWTTDQASSSQVQYGPSLPYTLSSALNSTLVNTHSVTLTGLAVGTTYNYAVVSTSSAGVTGTSANFTFTTSGGSAATTVSIGTTVLQPSVKRLGINLGTLTSFDSGQITQNLITQNPGFEGQIWNSTIQCASGTATSCVDQNAYSGWTAGFWNGATYQVFSGAAAGRAGTITTSTAAGSGQGVTLNFNNSGVAPAAGDYLIVRKSVPGNSSGGWSTNAYGAATVTDNLTDLPPGTTGRQTIALTAPTQSDYATVSTVIDNTSGVSFVQLNGTYQLQFKAKGIAGSSSIGVQLSRTGVASYLNQAVTLTNSWNTYNLTFSAAENGAAVGGIQLAFGTVYGADSFELDDVSLTPLNSDPTNTTVFRDSVVSTLRNLQPGILRYWGGNGQLGETLDNLLTPQFGRQRAGYSAYYIQSNQIDYGLHEFLVLCQTLGAEPWFVVPSTFSTTDAANLIEYLSSNAGASAYGAKRAILGQTQPWTQVFPIIHLEFGEQEWNSTYYGGSILNPVAYATQAQTIFAAMQADPLYVSGSIDFVLGGEANAPATNTIIQSNCNNNTSFDIAPYLMNQVNNFADNPSLFGTTFAEPEALMSATNNATAEGLTPGLVYQDVQAVQSSTHPVPLSVSEINLSTTGGSITQQALNSYVSSLGAGLAVADTMFQGLAQFDIVNQSLNALPQYSFTRPDGSAVYLYGSVVDMGVTNRKRPQFLALELANQALSAGASMLQTSNLGANPTWDQPLLNNVYLNGAHELQSYAFQNGTNFSAVLFNLSLSATLPVTFTGTNAPTGSVQMQQLTSANPTDNNESANVVTIQPSTISQFSSSTSLSLPPYSMTVLTWSTSGSSAPVISGVAASSITANSATITWTTSQPAASLVNYGTTTAYGSASPVNSTLTTSHSVTISGLTAGTVYDFDVVSSGATSANATFTTTAAATPVISAVTVTAITANSATITWTTDQATSSLVNYGTTTAYGSASPLNGSLTTSHSVTLSGLSASTLYNFDAVSANSAGTSATSSNATFTTSAAAAPVISAVTVTGITATSATITWTTDQSTSSLVNYGTTTSYGSASTLNSTLTTSHSVTITGLSASTLYNFDVVSANSAGTKGTSPNATFTSAAAGAPVISAVTVTGITAASATITWTTDQSASSLVNYGTTTSYGSASALNSTLTTSHSVTITGLNASTLYNFDVVSANSAGTTATSPNATFTTSAAPTPVISAVTVTGITSSSATITWTTDQSTSSTVNYGTTTAYGSTSSPNSTLTTSHSVTITGLTASTLYNFDVISANSAGTTATSPNATFTTSAAPTPVISAVTVTGITASSATITWTTDQATSSLVNYGTTTSYGSSSSLNSTLATSHSVTITGLTAGTLYDFDVVSANAAGTTATSANSTFTTSPASAPVISAVTVTGITASSATITWTTNQSASSLVNYGTTTAYGSSSTLNSTLSTSHSVTISALTAGTLYNFDVVSANSAGTTATSPNSTFTTSAAPTPVISAVTVTGITSTSATITWTTDQATSSLVNYGTTTSYGSASTLNSTLTTSHSVTITGLTASTLYDFDVVSANSAGTKATSANSTFTTSAAATPVISAVSATAITATSATITWTTDQATSSLVNYGTTTSYGSASTLNSNLTTTHSVTLTGLTAGTLYDFDVVSANSAGTKATSANATFTTSSATPVISAVAVSSITANSATITWTTDQATSSFVNYGTTTSYGSGSTYSSTLVTSHAVTITGLTAGTLYNFDVVSANSAGTSATSPNSTFTTSAGSAPYVGYVAFWGVNNSGVTISWSTDVLANTQLAYGTTTALGQLSPLQTTMTNSHGVVLTGLNSGTTYYFVAQSTGANGVTGYSTTYSFTTTGTAPTPTPVISAVAATSVASTSATITWTTDQATSSQVNYGVTTTYGSSSSLNSTLTTSHTVVLSGLTAGATYDFQVVSANSSNVTAVSANNTFTTTAAAATPVISNVIATAISSSSATITWTTDQATSSQVNYGTSTTYGSSSTLNTALVTSHSVTLIGLTASTTYDFDVTSANSSNVSATSTNYSFITTASTVTPVISNVTTSAITSTSVTITWTTDQATSSQVNYGATTTYGSSSPLNSTLTTSHSVTLTGLTQGVTYDYDVVSANSSNVTATSSNYTFTTTAVSATPVISNVTAGSISTSSVTIAWTTDQATSSQVNYGTSTSYGSSSSLNSSLVTSHSVTLTGLNSGTTYDFDVVSANSSNVSATSPNSTFVTTTSAPVAPVISNVATSGVTSTSVTITWTTSQPASSQVNYGATTSYGSSSPVNTTLATSQSVTLTGLTPGTTYDFDVVSANSSGVSATSPNSVFTTAAPSTPVISNVTSTGVTSTSATVTWTTDQATTSLVNYGTSTTYGSSSTLSTTLVTSHSVTLTGLTAGTTYDFQVVSADSANVSAKSSNYTFATPAASATPPNVSYVAFWGITTSGVTISWSTDQTATTQVAYGTTTALGQLTPIQSALSNSHGVTLTGLTSGTTYYFVCQSTAANGATGYSTVYSFTTVAVASGPTISNVVIVPGSGNTAQVSWTTSVPTNSYVVFGPTTAYGRYSSETSLTASPSPAMGYVPSGVIHYQLVSTDANGNQTISPDATFTEP